MTEVLRVFVGYDSREDAAWQVCRQSILGNTASPVDVRPLRQRELRRVGLYRRGSGERYIDDFDGRPFSTEFAFTRFLVPHLMLYEGWALFVDCDFMFREDIAQLFALRDERYAVMCVHHDYSPPVAKKMDGRSQEPYSRKNWSSLVLWNCGHPANRKLTVDAVNTLDGRELHNFMWLGEARHMGEIPGEWNWIEGVTEGEPKAVHFTTGVPTMTGYENVAYADEWRAVLKTCG